MGKEIQPLRFKSTGERDPAKEIQIHWGKRSSQADLDALGKEIQPSRSRSIGEKDPTKEIQIHGERDPDQLGKETSQGNSEPLGFLSVTISESIFLPGIPS